MTRAEGLPREAPGCGGAALLAVVALVAVVLLLAGCAPPDSTPTPVPGPAVTR